MGLVGIEFNGREGGAQSLATEQEEQDEDDVGVKEQQANEEGYHQEEEGTFNFLILGRKLHPLLY